MTGRQKIDAALSPSGTRHTPAVICYEGIYVRDHWDQLTSAPWWNAWSPDLERQVAWRREAFAATRQDWFDLPACPSRAEREALSLEAEAGEAWLVDRLSGQRRRLRRPLVGGWSPEGGVHSVHADRLPESDADVDAMVPEPAEFDAGRFVAEGRADLARALLEEFGRELYPIGSVSSPLWGCYERWGFDGMMLLVATRRDLVRRACERLLARRLVTVRAAAALGAAGMWVEDCLTDMISPDAFAELSVPFLQRLIEAIRVEGMKSIFYFCGNPVGKWDMLFATGADALSLEESKKGFSIDIEEVVARAAGRCAVLGNLDAIGLLPNGSEAQLRAEIARQLRAGRRNGGRFIMSIGSPVTPGTPVARVRRYCDLVRELSDEPGRSEPGLAGCGCGTIKASRPTR